MGMAPAAIGIILSADKKKVLLVRRRDNGMWVLPGGGIEAGESPKEAVIREAAEETGFSIKVERKCAEYYPVNKLASFTNVFICSVDKGTSKLSDETTAVEFFPLDHLPPSMFKIHKQWIQEGLSSSALILKPLDQITYKAVFIYFLRHPIKLISYLWTRFTKK